MWKIDEAKESRGKMNNITTVYNTLRKLIFSCTTWNMIIILESDTSLIFHKGLIANENLKIQASYSNFFFLFHANTYLICSFICPKLFQSSTQQTTDFFFPFYLIPVNLSKQIWKSAS